MLPEHFEYMEACYECYSLNLNVKFKEQIETDVETIYVIEIYCRDCGESWDDFAEV